ncbi:hypothetical protein GGS26DRAFT_603258 [Hypomontagnella submonticulosa]|nr:hypothetical protein GGS26DRAFT_603258 [Hypomontagnella submonticulosa]
MERLKAQLRRLSINDEDFALPNGYRAGTRHSRSRSESKPTEIQISESPRRIKGPRHSIHAEDVAGYDIKTHGPLECTSGHTPIIEISRSNDQPEWPLRDHCRSDICTFQIPERSMRRKNSLSNQVIKEEQAGISPTQSLPHDKDDTLPFSSKESRSGSSMAKSRTGVDTPPEVYEDCLEEIGPDVPTETTNDLTKTVDTDQTTTYAPAVTHEIVRPQVHEIIEEQIYREIHNHDVYHRIQPVYDIEVLPARHLVPGDDGRLVEVSEDKLPDCTGEKQKWYMGKGPAPAVPSPPRSQPDTAAIDSPRQGSADRGSLKSTESSVIEQRGFKDVYHDNWQASAARAF